MEAAIPVLLWVNFASSMALFGGCGFRLLAPERAAAAAIDPVLRCILIGAAVLALLGALALLGVEAAAMADDWSAAVDPDTVGDVLTSTTFGQVWVWRLILGALAVAAAVRLGPHWAVLGLAVPLLATLALTGHAAMGEGVPGLLHRGNQMVHLLAAGAWLGGLIPLALLVRRAQAGRAGTEPVLRRFSAYGTVAVLLILASGCVNTFALIDPLSGLFSTPYGNVLLAKLALVASMIGIALVNRLILLPSLSAREGEAVARLRRSLAIEIVAGALVLAAASLLGTLAPAIA